MSTVIKLRRDALVSWSGYTLAEGEIGVVLSGSGNNIQVTEFKIGDGVHTWANLNQNWKPAISTIAISVGSASRTSTVSNSTASVDLNNLFAPSSSQIASITSSYVAASGTLLVGVVDELGGKVTGSVTINDVPSTLKAIVVSGVSASMSNRTASLSLANVYAPSSSKIVSASGSFNTTTGVLQFGVLDVNNNFLNANVSFSKVPNATSAETASVLSGNPSLTSSGTTDIKVIAGGKTSSAFTVPYATKAAQDESGNNITGSYLRKNGSSTGSQTVSGSVSVSNIISAATGTFDAIYFGPNDEIMYEGSGDLTISPHTVFTDGISVAETSYFEYLTVGNDGISSSGAIKSAGMISASGNIYTAGNVYAAGDVIAAYSSDRRLKKNIQPISSSAEILTRLKPVEFEWNEIAEELSEGHKTGKSRGFLADEFLEVLPNAGKKIWNKYDAIEYHQVIPYLVAGYQELKKEVEDLKAQIEELKKSK